MHPYDDFYALSRDVNTYLAAHRDEDITGLVVFSKQANLEFFYRALVTLSGEHRMARIFGRTYHQKVLHDGRCRITLVHADRHAITGMDPDVVWFHQYVDDATITDLQTYLKANDVRIL
jgi:hypothetical protein